MQYVFCLLRDTVPVIVIDYILPGTGSEQFSLFFIALEFLDTFDDAHHILANQNTIQVMFDNG